MKTVALSGRERGFPKSPEPIRASTMLFICCAVARVVREGGGDREKVVEAAMVKVGEEQLANKLGFNPRKEKRFHEISTLG